MFTKSVVKPLIVMAAVALASSAFASDADTNKATVKAALTGAFGDHDVHVIDRYFADPYIQHNPMLPSGVTAIRGLVANLAKGPKGDVQVHRTIAEGNLVAAHVTYTGFAPEPLVAFDIFRFNDEGKMIEHWDNLMPQAKPNKAGRTLTDGATEVTDHEKTQANKALVKELVNRLFINGENLDLSKYISPKQYLQHNPLTGDGLEGLQSLFKYFKDNKIAVYYTKLHQLIAEGNFVLAASEGVFGDKPTAYYDLFRVEDGLIVEHWDVISEMPSSELPKGYPGKF